jgi:autotransporter-associated beta strand protein
MQTKAHKRARLGRHPQTNRKIRVTRALAIAAAAGSISGLLAADSRAASDTWSGSPTDNNWIPTGQNWNSGPGNSPGSTSILTDSDVGTFNSTSSQTTININSTTLDIGGITFDTNAAAYTIGAAGANAGNSLLLSSGGTIQIASTFAGTGTTETINAPLTLEPGSASTIGTYGFANNNTTASNALSFAGNITGGTTSFVNSSDSAPDGGAIVLALGGANTGLNTISGLISDGGAAPIIEVGAGVAIDKTGVGTWYLTNTGNTYSGETEISQGILNVASLSNYGTASAIGDRAIGEDTTAHGGVGILLNGGTLQYTGSTAQSTNRSIRLGDQTTNTIDASGTGSGTLSFTATSSVNLFQTAGTRTLTLTGSNTGSNTFDIELTDQGGNQTTLAKSGAGTWVDGGNNSGVVAVTVNSGVLELTGSNSYTGALTVHNGATLQLQANAANTSGGISYAAGPAACSNCAATAV